MRLLSLLTMLGLLIPRLGAAQLATTFADAQARGLRITHLDSTYRSARHADTAQAAFAGREQEVAAAYGQLLQALGKYLHGHGFVWGKLTKGFNRVYFRPDGTIDYYLYNFRSGEVTAEKEAEFRRLLGEFIKTNRIALTGRMPFAQCSPVTYVDVR